MAGATLNINTEALEAYAARLEQLSKSDLPRVAAKTLSKAALNVKQKEMPEQASKNFLIKDKNFFKANSRVEFAKRQDPLNKMQSTVGFIRAGGYDPKSDAVKNLEKQEKGGEIDNRTFIPLNPRGASKGARGWGRKSKVMPKNRLSRIRGKKFISAKEMPGKTHSQRLIQAVEFAGRGNFVLSEKGVLFRVRAAKKPKNGKLKIEALYSVKRDRSVRIQKPTRFMEKASLESAKILDDIFIKTAEKQIDYRLKL